MSQEINSTTNPKLKALKKLQQKKYRDEHQQFVVENPLTIRDGIAQAIPTELYGMKYLSSYSWYAKD